ncbi:hypothetical protein MKZ38_008105 [Zalerion maritima]|uniref:FAD linked oxidase N-terminal domain-containing protein n=1 Tax=Zalerion maritima TaxID=339359 RepID=A0AAD5S2M7_9PEZI|nr:hypothetical protein MKZ38_008105 [Zalerion maritima]
MRLAILTLGLCAANLSSAGAFNRRAMVLDCLAENDVPFDTEGLNDWELDGAAFNLRIPYTPVAIAVPTGIGNIQGTVTCTRELGLKVSAKCGGHGYANFGFGGEDGHLVLEIDRMYNVTLDRETNIATIQGGKTVTHFTIAVAAKTTVEKAVAGMQAMQDFVVSGTIPSELTMRLFLTPRFVNFEGLLYGDEDDTWVHSPPQIPYIFFHMFIFKLE